MPVAYYGSKLSPHITETPEGYLICHDAPINRIGTQDYLGSELGLRGADAERTFPVLRRKEEVFSPETLASFEGKPVCDDHPPEDVTPQNVNVWGKGHVQNVRADSTTGQTLADLFATDENLIREIQSGKRDISCGYIYDLYSNPNGTFEQRNIRGNHIAIVDKGRAGPRVCIRDSQPKLTERGKNMSERKGGIWGRMLHAFATDADTTPDDIEEAAKLIHASDEDVTKVGSMPSPESKMSEKATEPKKAVDDVDMGGDKLDKIIEMLGALTSRVEKLESGHAEDNDDKDDLQKIIEEAKTEGETPEQEIKEQGESEPSGDFDPVENENEVTRAPEDIPEKEDGYKPQVVKTGDSAAQMGKAAKIVRDILYKEYGDKPAEFKQRAMDASAALHKAYGIPKGNNSGYLAVVNSINARKAQLAQQARDQAGMTRNEKMLNDTQNAYDAINPHMAKGGK